MEKLVYKDGQHLKVLRGTRTGENDFFIVFECDDSVYEVNKKDIVSLKTDKGGNGNGRTST